MKKLGKTQRLAVWFQTEILHGEVNWTSPQFRRLLNQCKYMMETMKLDEDLVKRAVELMVDRGVLPSSPNLTYLGVEETTQKSWLELAENPLLLAPPVYETNRLRDYLKQFDPQNPLLRELGA